MEFGIVRETKRELTTDCTTDREMDLTAAGCTWMLWVCLLLFAVKSLREWCMTVLFLY